MQFSISSESKKEAVYVTGMGAVSALGIGVEAQLEGLKKEQDAITIAELIPNQRKAAYAGEIKLSNSELAKLAGASDKLPRTTLLGLIAAKEAWKGQESPDQRTGLISASTVGGMDLSEHFYLEYKQSGAWDKVDTVKTHDIGTGADEIAKVLGIKGYLTSLSTACSSAANAIMLGARLIQSGALDRVLVGGMDALANFTLNGFSSLMIYSPEKVSPFDLNRKGVNLGEGAAFLVLESASACEQHQKRKLGQVCGWGNANDAYHQTASSPEGTGAQLAMNKALQVAGLGASEITYVNAHGTGTENNDLSESTALLKVFEGKVPPFSSTKAYTGHTLATCGALEAIYSLLMIQEKCLFPNLNFRKAISETKLEPITTTMKVDEVSYILSNSFGFGGNNSTIILGKA